MEMSVHIDNQPFKYRLYDETEGSTGFRAPRKLYRHPRAKVLYYTANSQ